MKHLILVRGVPGAGKTTFSNTIATHPLNVVSADMYFEETGKYKFDGSKLGEAHDWCKNTVRYMMINNADQIIVANTFTRAIELEAYYELAREHNYTAFSIIVENRHGGVNIHGAPESTVEKMKNRFEIKL